VESAIFIASDSPHNGLGYTLPPKASRLCFESKIQEERASVEALPSPCWDTEMIPPESEVSSRTTVRVVSRRGSSKAVGSARMRFL